MIGHPASVRFILITLVIDALGFGLVVPIVPSLVLQLSGLTVSGASNWVGLLLTAFALMQFACAPILGALSDRFGRRPVLLLSLSGICANYLLLAWAPSLAWLFLGRLIAGATAANAATATAYIADVTPPAEARRPVRAGRRDVRRRLRGRPGAGRRAGRLWPAPAVHGGGGAGRMQRAVRTVRAAGEPAAGAPPGDSTGAGPTRWARCSVVMASRNLARLAIAWGSIWFALGALQSTFVLANEVRFGWDTRHNGLALALAGLGSAVVQGLLVRRIVPGLGERRAAMIGAMMTAVAYLCIALAPFGWVVVLGIVLQSVGAITSPAMQGMVSAVRRGGPAGGDAGRLVVGAGADGDRFAAGRQLGVLDVHRSGGAGAAARGAVPGLGAGLWPGDLGGVGGAAGAGLGAGGSAVHWPPAQKPEETDADTRARSRRHRP